MRTRTDQEKEAMGKVEPIFRVLKLKQVTPGTIPLMDIIIYAYAYPEEKFLEMFKLIEKENDYLGIRMEGVEERIDSLKRAMVETIMTALEVNMTVLEGFGLGKLRVIVDEDTDPQIDVETKLLEDIGEKYQDYTHEERVIVFFVKKVLKFIKPKQAQ